MMSEVAVIDTPRPTLVAGAKPTAIVPRTMEEVFRLANAVFLAGMTPYGLETAEKCTIAILHGMEIGLPPMMALQRIAVINGRPTIFGDAALGLVRASGLCGWVKETIDGQGDARTAVCEARRKGEPATIRRTFSVADAKLAKLWGKTGPKGPTPWVTMPDRMLLMRARGFCLRDGFADVLGGLYLKEEMDDVGDTSPRPAQSRVNEPPAPPPPPPAIAGPVGPPAPPEAVHDSPQSRKTLATAADVLAELKRQLDAATSQADCDAAWETVIEGSPERLNDGEVDEAQALLREAAQKFWAAEAGE